MTALHEPTTTTDTRDEREHAALHALEAAALAPSSHNVQPWRFSRRGTTIELFADQARGLAVSDPAGRELVIACGAALLNARVAIGAAGFDADVTRFPDPADPTLIARITVGEERTVDEEVGALAAALPRRRTNRLPYDGRKVGAKLRRSLEAAARAEGAELHFFEDDAHHRIAVLVGEAERAQFRNAAYRRELADWLRPNGSPAHDGMRGDGFGLGRLRAGLRPAAVRRLGIGPLSGRHDRRLAERTRGIAVLTTAGDEPRDWLAAGEALERVLLTLTAMRGAASFLNGPVELPAFRERLAEHVPGARPQLLLRIGYPTEIPPAQPRRALGEIAS